LLCFPITIQLLRCPQPQQNAGALPLAGFSRLPLIG